MSRGSVSPRERRTIWERMWIDYALPAYAPHSSSNGSAAEYDRLIRPPRTEFLDKGVIDIPASYAAFNALPAETRLYRMDAFGPRRRPHLTQEGGSGGHSEESYPFLQFYLHIRSLEAYYIGQGTLAFRDPYFPRGGGDYIRFAKALSVNQDESTRTRPRGSEAGLFREPVYLSDEVGGDHDIVYLPNYHLITSLISDLPPISSRGNDRDEVLKTLQAALTGLEKNGAMRFIGMIRAKREQVAAYTDDLFYLRNRSFIRRPQLSKDEFRVKSDRLKTIRNASASGNLYLVRDRTSHSVRDEGIETEEEPSSLRTMEYVLRGNRESICNAHETEIRRRCNETAALFMEKTNKFIRAPTSSSPPSPSPSPSSPPSPPLFCSLPKRSLSDRRGGVFLTANPTRVHIDPTITILHILDRFREEASKCHLSSRKQKKEGSPKSPSFPEEERSRPIVLWISSHSGTVGSRRAAAEEDSDGHWRPGEAPVQMQLDEYIRNILRLAWDHVPSLKPKKGASSFVGRYPGDAEVLGALDSIFGPMVSSDEVARETGETYSASTRPSRPPRDRDSSSVPPPPASYRFISHDEFFEYCGFVFRESTSNRQEHENIGVYNQALGLFFGAQPTETGLTFQRVGAFYNMILVIDDLPGFWGHEHVSDFRICLENEASRGRVSDKDRAGGTEKEGGSRGHFPLLMFVCRDGGELFYSHPANAWMSTLHECLSTLARFPVPLSFSSSSSGKRKEREKEQQASEDEDEGGEKGGDIISFDSISDAPELGLTPYGGSSSRDNGATKMFEGIQKAHIAASEQFLYAGPPDGWPTGRHSVVPNVRLTIEHYVPVTYVGAQQLLIGPPVPGRGWDGMAHDLELQIARRFEAIDLEDCGYVHLPSWKFKDSDCTKPVAHLHGATMTDEEQ